jgi:hypothetical protein
MPGPDLSPILKVRYAKRQKTGVLSDAWDFLRGKDNPVRDPGVKMRHHAPRRKHKKLRINPPKR